MTRQARWQQHHREECRRMGVCYHCPKDAKLPAVKAGLCEEHYVVNATQTRERYRKKHDVAPQWNGVPRVKWGQRKTATWIQE